MTLKELRLKKGLTQKQLAEELGMIQAEISNLENGKRNIMKVQLRTAKKIANYFGIKVDDLLGGDE